MSDDGTPSQGERAARGLFEGGDAAPPAESKRKVGRPRGSKTKRPAEPEIIPPAAQREDEEAKRREKEQLEEEARQLFDALIGQSDEFAVMAGELYGLPFDFAAAKSGCSDIALSDEKKLARGRHVLRVVRHYAPSLAKHLPLIMFGAAVATDVATAVMLYKKHAAAQRPTTGGSTVTPPMPEARGVHVDAPVMANP